MNKVSALDLPGGVLEAVAKRTTATDAGGKKPAASPPAKQKAVAKPAGKPVVKSTQPAAPVVRSLRFGTNVGASGRSGKPASNFSSVDAGKSERSGHCGRGRKECQSLLAHNSKNKEQGVHSQTVHAFTMKALIGFSFFSIFPFFFPKADC